MHARSLTRMSLAGKRRDVTAYYRSRGGTALESSFTRRL